MQAFFNCRTISSTSVRVLLGPTRGQTTSTKSQRSSRGQKHRMLSSSSSSSPQVERVLVVGAGAIGLRTALELLHRNVSSIVLRAPRHPLHPETCSMGAGGLWMPFHCNDVRVNRWAKETLDELLAIHHQDEKNDQSSTSPLVELVPVVRLMREHGGPQVSDFTENKYEPQPGGHTVVDKLPEWTRDSRLAFQHLTVEMLCWQNVSYKLRIPTENELKSSGYLHAWFFRPPIVDAPKMLQHMLDEIQNSKNVEVDVDVEMEHKYESLDELQDEARNLDCDAVINCTGLGASKLCPDDKKMVGARGILLKYNRSRCQRRPEIVNSGQYDQMNVHDAVIMTEDAPWGSETMPCYLIPRGDTIVVGGSYLEGDTEKTIRDDERQRLLTNAHRLGIDIRASQPDGDWVGFRPFRSQVRCEIDGELSTDDLKVVHNYGFGGSGWTVNVGAAKEVGDLLLGKR